MGSRSSVRAAASWPTYVHPRRIKGGEQFQGAGIAQAATFVFSVKEPLFTLLRDEIKDDARKLAEEMWTATTLLDKLGLYKSLSCVRSTDDHGGCRAELFLDHQQAVAAQLGCLHPVRDGHQLEINLSRQNEKHCSTDERYEAAVMSSDF